MTKMIEASISKAKIDRWNFAQSDCCVLTLSNASKALCFRFRQVTMLVIEYIIQKNNRIRNPIFALAQATNNGKHRKNPHFNPISLIIDFLMEPVSMLKPQKRFPTDIPPNDMVRPYKRWIIRKIAVKNLTLAIVEFSSIK